MNFLFLIGFSLLPLYIVACLHSQEDDHDTHGHDFIKNSANYLFVGKFIPKPDHAQVGNNEMSLELSGTDSVLISGATIKATPWMREHDHGTNIVPSVTSSSNGIYQIVDINYTMAGPWELNIIVTKDVVTDTFKLTFEVD